MTLPTTATLPIHSDKIIEGGEALDKYMKELVVTLQRQYEDMAEAINGDFKLDVLTGSSNFTPTISGSTTSGVGTYVANTQTSRVLRKGLEVEFWFDIAWTAHTGTGNLLVDLPYEVADSANFPYVGVVMAENITFSGYLTGTALPATRSFQIIDTRSATTFNNIAVTNANTTLRGYVKYIGKAIERN